MLGYNGFFTPNISAIWFCVSQTDSRPILKAIPTHLSAHDKSLFLLYSVAVSLVLFFVDYLLMAVYMFWVVADCNTKIYNLGTFIE